MKTLALILVPLVSFAGQQRGQPESAAPMLDWWAIDKAVVEQLLTEDMNTVVRSLAAAQMPRDAAELLRRLSLFVRAGHRESAAKTIDRLATVPPPAEKSVLSHTADFLIDRQEWDLTRWFLERLPQAEPGWGYVFIKHWTENGDSREIDRWLAARMRANPEYWLRERFRFRTALGTETELLNELAADVRAHPTDLARAERYLDAISTVGKKSDLDWMGQVCRPRLAYESYKLGHALIHRSPRAAIALLERSLATPFTDQDQKLIDQEIRHRMAAFMPPQIVERDLRLWTKTALAQSYKADGQADKAQPLIEELAAASKDGLPHVSWSQFAGEVQAESGARVIEGRIREAEAKSENSSDYWHTRAKYYAGRNEEAQAVEAFEKALELAPFDPSNVTKLSTRRFILRDYVGYKAGTAGAREALRLLCREFDSIRLDTDYAAWLVHDMRDYDQDDAKFLHADNERLWAHLAARTQWGHYEEKLLWRMISNVPAKERDPYWSRAEKLVETADPTRALKLGWIMTRTNESARAIPLLRDAVERLPDGDDKKSATFTLFEAYLDTSDWQGAQALWPLVRQRLTPREIPDWLGRIAAAAAKVGAADDAMQLWRAKANLDRSDFRHLDELARLGLKQRLRDFYQRMSADDSSTWAPAAALRRLQ
jgi:tetratricopeptide (TPR) repeat protein